MKLYCDVDNLGYGEVIEISYNGENDIFLRLKFNNNDTKRFSYNIAAGKTLFVDDKKSSDDKEKIWNFICKTLGEKAINEINNGMLEYSIGKKRDEIYEILKNEYNFRGFMHETTIGNLANILKDGKLKPRNELYSFEDSANSLVINHTSEEVKNKVRFYFFRKTPTNYHFDSKNPNNMVYIVFKWNLVNLPGATFVNGNASSEYSDSKLAIEYFKNPSNFMDWGPIAHRGFLPSYEECVLGAGFDDRNDIVRKRNAEINIPGSVKIDFINKIVFRTMDEYNRFIKILNNDIILNRFIDKMEIDSSYFN